ncbi:retrovirus-related pol polyprotein from transposon TNT 1-94 [Tanacetum coccineum]
MQISQLNETSSEADRTRDFRTLDVQITQLTEKINVLEEQNELFRAKNGKIKQHYKELYDSIRFRMPKASRRTTALINDNESLKGGTDRPLVFGLRLFKTYDRGSLAAQEFHEKVYRDEVAFRKHSYYVRDTDGVELIKGSCGSNLYTISIEDMLKSSPICLLSKASKNKSWLWHRCLNHLNFGKSKKHTHKPKTENTNLEVLNALHMNLCGPMRFQTMNGKKYILVIVDDYSRFTWVKFLRSKDEILEVVIKFLKQIQVGLNKTVRNIHIDNGTKFVNKDLTDYYELVGIFHQKTVSRTPQQNDVVERWNPTLVEAAKTMMIFSNAPMFLWAEAVANACYTQNRSLIHTRHYKTPYELVHNKKPDLTFFRVFGALCYPTNNSEDLGKLQPTADI